MIAKGKLKKKSEMTKSQLEKHRVANKKVAEKDRTNKKDKTTTSTPINAFKTPQSLGKAKKS